MNATEILATNKTLLATLLANDVSIRDVQWIDLAFEYGQMRERGEKAYYAKMAMADKYGITIRSVERILKRLSKRVFIAS